MAAQQHMVQATLASLRPTQVTVGLAEVALKRAQWAQVTGTSEREQMLKSHWFPAVLGANNCYYIVDHHHLGLALTQEAIDNVWVMQLADFSALDEATFWRVMEYKRWVHPYDANGERCKYAAIPRDLGKLKDDPYRSLAGEVRKAGGYAKDAEPYSEFLWADFFRTDIGKAKLRAAPDGGLSEAVVQEAVVLARSHKADFLPGWAGPSKAIVKAVVKAVSQRKGGPAAAPLAAAERAATKLVQAAKAEKAAAKHLDGQPRKPSKPTKASKPAKTVKAAKAGKHT